MSAIEAERLLKTWSVVAKSWEKPTPERVHKYLGLSWAEWSEAHDVWLEHCEAERTRKEP